MEDELVTRPRPLATDPGRGVGVDSLDTGKEVRPQRLDLDDAGAQGRKRGRLGKGREDGDGMRGADEGTGERVAL
jgi:hypothetical protein